MDTRATSKRRDYRSTVIATLLVAAAGAIAWFGYDPGAPAGQPTFAQATETLPADPATFSAPAAARSHAGLPTRVRIESAGVDSAVAEVGVVRVDGVAAWQTAWRAAGHHIDSALPGNPGNVVLTGHVSVANPDNVAVFANLDRVQVGDIVEIYSGEKLHRYAVEAVSVVGPDQVKVLEGDHRSRITLITCTRDLQNRLVVVGSLVA